eukprot:355161-Chlamydomonas_euryale.AAC.3
MARAQVWVFGGCGSVGSFADKGRGFKAAIYACARDSTCRFRGIKCGRMRRVRLRFGAAALVDSGLLHSGLLDSGRLCSARLWSILVSSILVDSGLLDSGRFCSARLWSILVDSGLPMTLSPPASIPSTEC